MPVADVRGVKLNYEIVGDAGPWVTLSPGGRRAGDDLTKLAGMIADAGYRVLLHDRRNCGASDVSIGGDVSESEVWADDLVELLRQLGATPAYVGGVSSGCRMSLHVAIRHPEAVKALLLWRVSGGEWSANRLAGNYYGQFIEMAKQGGMAAVCASDHFAAVIAANPSNRERLMSMPVDDFIAKMEDWQQYFFDGAHMPSIGTTEEQLRKLTMPACILPGHDNTHPEPVAKVVHGLMPNSEMYEVMTEQEIEDQRAAGAEIIYERDEAVAPVFIDFLARVSGAVRA